MGPARVVRTIRAVVGAWTLVCLGACQWAPRAAYQPTDATSTHGAQRELALRDPAVVAPSEDRCIRGVVHTEGFLARPLRGAKVSFYREGLEVFQTETDTRGYFYWCHGESDDEWVVGRDTLTWIVRISHPGYVVADRRLVWEWHEKPDRIDVALTPAANALLPIP